MSAMTILPSDQTVKIFDNFYSTKLEVNASEWDLVYSYFKASSDNDEVAKNFATMIFKIAKLGNYNVTDLLAAVKGTDNKLQMNQVICYYLNTFRNKISLYGIGLSPKPNESVQRNVVM